MKEAIINLEEAITDFDSVPELKSNHFTEEELKEFHEHQEKSAQALGQKLFNFFKNDVCHIFRKMKWKIITIEDDSDLPSVGEENVLYINQKTAGRYWDTITKEYRLVDFIKLGEIHNKIKMMRRTYKKRIKRKY
jgi:hypothetical protein